MKTENSSLKLPKSQVLASEIGEHHQGVSHQNPLIFLCSLPNCPAPVPNHSNAWSKWGSWCQNTSRTTPQRRVVIQCGCGHSFGPDIRRWQTAWPQTAGEKRLLRRFEKWPARAGHQLPLDAPRGNLPCKEPSCKMFSSKWKKNCAHVCSVLLKNGWKSETYKVRFSIELNIRSPPGLQVLPGTGDAGQVDNKTTVSSLKGSKVLWLAVWSKQNP